ncbi:MAG: poly(3-hydroxybutyrate) depolymerase, partial [Burkholderiales bacterium]|nr:poly(3-hydroxybutyrate) depolymerase [Burkholderiales bacterium]
FFSTYGNVFSLYLADKAAARPEGVAEPRELPFVQEALRAIGEGGYPEALARVACLLARKGEPLLLSRLSAKREMLADYKGLVPDLPPDQWRRVRGEQEVIVRYAPEEALATLPALLRDEGDRARLVTLVRSLLADERVRRAQPTIEQLAMVEEIGKALSVTPRKATRRATRKPAGRKAARK